ncbi:hypothetical protein GCM10027075_26390 [Streptomyces heilongjiangensis]
MGICALVGRRACRLDPGMVAHREKRAPARVVRVSSRFALCVNRSRARDQRLRMVDPVLPVRGMLGSRIPIPAPRRLPRKPEYHSGAGPTFADQAPELVFLCRGGGI